MNAERQVTRESAVAMMAQVNEAIAAGNREATVELAGMQLQLELTPDGRVTLRAPGQEVGAELFVAPDAVPQTYPADMPFIAGETVAVTECDRESSLMWWTPADPASLLRDLDVQLLAADWTLQHQAPIAGGTATQLVYLRDHVKRFVHLSEGIIGLFQKGPHTTTSHHNRSS